MGNLPAENDPVQPEKQRSSFSMFESLASVDPPPAARRCLSVRRLHRAAMSLPVPFSVPVRSWRTAPHQERVSMCCSHLMSHTSTCCAAHRIRHSHRLHCDRCAPVHAWEGLHARRGSQRRPVQALQQTHSTRWKFTTPQRRVSILHLQCIFPVVGSGGREEWVQVVPVKWRRRTRERGTKLSSSIASASAMQFSPFSIPSNSHFRHSHMNLTRCLPTASSPCAVTRSLLKWAGKSIKQKCPSTHSDDISGLSWSSLYTVTAFTSSCKLYSLL